MVEWRDYQLDGPRTNNEQPWIYKKKELLSVQDIRTGEAAADQMQEEQQRLSTVRDLAKTRCVPTSHCAGDEEFIQKGRQTLFINASWSLSKEEAENENDEEQPWVQWPWLVDIELPKKKSEETKPDPPQQAKRKHPKKKGNEGTPKKINEGTPKKSNEGTPTNEGANNCNCSRSKTKGSKKL